MQWLNLTQLRRASTFLLNLLKCGSYEILADTVARIINRATAHRAFIHGAMYRWHDIDYTLPLRFDNF